MGKGKRAHTISIPSINLTAPKSSADHSYAPSNFIGSLSGSASEKTHSSVERWKPPRKPKMKYDDLEHKMEATPLYVLVCTYLNYFVLILFGHLRDILGKFFKPQDYSHLKNSQGYAPLVSDFDSFYTRRLYVRIRDCFNRPITGIASRTVKLLDRVSTDFNKTFKLTGTTTEALNFASYNYLGFSDNQGPCADSVEHAVQEFGITAASSRAEAGTTKHIQELEKIVARFVGKEAAMCVSMGFATNSTTIPSLVGKGCLVISDELNHASIVFGVRLSGASVRVFKHNNMDDLRELLREVISQGQPRTHRPWKKILIVVEGLYSMEGTIVNLPELIELKKEFKFYLYVDEAHSIGALGENGGGVCDFYGIDPAEVDILMGTFTKSFGAAGGYIAGDKAIIDHIRLRNHAYNYAESISVPVAQQVITSMKIICGEDGTDTGRKKIKQLAENSVYFIERLREMGFIVYGDQGSPVIPLLLFNPAKIPAFSRELLKRGIATVVVGYPATPIITSRARFCLSSAHTKEDLDRTLQAVSEVGDILLLKVSKESK
ncbi:pyridoxal phosphate-dependent transferase [Cokeromyces recurvatus]|uniref:pyridoxal phosphate-dependent transferase n=1 Tax=Cokeromyces recurvatus TaxID=90255 RepID=UPI00221FA1FE|nr:pyridoxal phosphate-dependent transferase [Cokeromyces recurvatus]KAI7903826.1 pyridoxal phosphate-dependent transferase [Cokeromyces recurvatus]